MAERWQDLQRAAERLEANLERARHRMTHSERSEAERDLRIIKDEARKQRQDYVNWLWGF